MQPYRLFLIDYYTFLVGEAEDAEDVVRKSQGDAMKAIAAKLSKM